MLFCRQAVLIAAFCLTPFHVWATAPKIDAETCTSLRLEQIKFRQSGILDDMNKGAAWAKTNLSADRLREIQHYLELDEQVQFGCRDAKLTAEAKRASEAAARIELNSDADPTAPVAHDPPKPENAAKKAVPKSAVKKTTPKTKSAKAKSDKESNADTSVHPPVIVQSEAGPIEAPAEQAPSLPAFGFGETSVFSPAAP
jgi:hypothetical protein